MVILAPCPLVERRVARGAKTTFNQLVPRARGCRSYAHRPPIFLPFSNFGHRKTLSFQSDETALETDRKSRRPTSKNGGPRLLTIADGSVARARLIPRRFPRDFRVVTATRALQLAWSRTTVCCARVALLCQPSAFPASLQPDWALDTVLGHNLRRKSATHQLSSQLPSCSRCTRALLLHACLFLLLCSAGAQLVAHAHS